MAKDRLVYIDHLRIFLISLVVLLHLAITYGAPGDWYYNEAEITDLSVIPLSMFNATNQAFFMGMFFFISAFFTELSLRRKSVRRFIADRLVRLGIPMMVFYFVLSPITVFLLVRFGRGESITVLEFLRDTGGFGWGPMWFVEALLIFTAVYLVVFLLRGGRDRAESKSAFPLPGNLAIVLLALLIGVLQFVIRLRLPVGWSFEPFGFQFPHFVQYIVLFSFGIVAAKNDWLSQLTERRALKWMVVAQTLIFIGFPVVFGVGGAMDGNLEPFMGGPHWQALAYALWEQLVGFALIIGLIGFFRKYLGTGKNWSSELSASAYAVYIIHPPVAVGLAILFKNWELYPLFKFMVLGPVIVGICFLVAGLIRRIPGVSRVV